MLQKANSKEWKKKCSSLNKILVNKEIILVWLDVDVLYKFLTSFGTMKTCYLEANLTTWEIRREEIE